MRAMQIIEWGKPLEAREYPDPEPQGEEVLLRVEATGVCHSDVHIWDGFFDLGGEQRISLESRGVRLPFTMGHEIAGEVAALGPHASGIKVGDKLVAYPWIGCGECAVCRKGEELLCLSPRTLGTRRAGGYATHVIVPRRKKRVVLGLVTSKRPVLESKDELKRRVDEAAKYVPLDQLCLSPQCGFSSTVDGNALTIDEEKAKLRLVVDTAREVWG